MRMLRAGCRPALPLLCVLAALALPLAVGCGGKVAKTPRGTAQAFVNFMKAGKYKEAAELWDYDAQGRAGNSDWDTFSASQRELIIKESKWVDEKTQSMKLWSSHFSGNVEVMAVAESGGTATATLEGGRVPSVDLVKVGEEWRVAAIN